MFLSLQMAELPASAAGRFSDVPAGSPFYESVTYLAECGITAGTGGHSFSPERPITVREWAALLFRAFDGSTLSCDSPKEPVRAQYPAVLSKRLAGRECCHIP